MKRILIILCTCLAVITAHAQSPAYINNGRVVQAPQIHSQSFVNNGEFLVGLSGRFFSFNFDDDDGQGGFNDLFIGFGTFEGTGVPYDTLGTLSYTNRGLMSGFPGFRLEYIDNNGVRHLADTIHNHRGATLEAANTLIFTDGNLYHYGDGARILLRATNIISEGLLNAGFVGDLSMEGRRVILASSPIEVNQPPADSRARIGDSFVPPIGVEDIWWRYGEDFVNFATLSTHSEQVEIIETPDGPVEQVVHVVTARSPSFRYENELTLLNGTPADELPRTTLPFGPSLPESTFYYIRTNTFSPTNQMVTAVFVNNPNPNLFVDAGFAPSGNPDLPAPSVRVFAGAVLTNNIIGGYEIQGLLLTENHGNDPLPVTLSNRVSSLTRMPTNVTVSRLPRQLIPISRAQVESGEMAQLLSAESVLARYRLTLGLGTNAPHRADLFTAGIFPALDPDEALPFDIGSATNAYVTYAASVNSRPSTVPNIPNASITNMSGRVSIHADYLDISNTRIRAPGLVNIHANHFVSSAGTSIQAPNVNMVLGSTNGSLVINRIIPTLAEGLDGDLRMYTSTWTNLFEIEREEPGEPDPETGETEDETITLSGETLFHVVYVDFNLSTFQPVQTANLRLTAGNVSFMDVARVTELTASSTTNLFIGGTLQLVGSEDISVQNFPNLSVLTNAGTLIVPNIVNLGADRPNRLLVFDNSGEMEVSGLLVNTVSFENSGELFVEGPTSIVADQAVFDGGNSILFSERDLEVRAGEIYLGDALFFGLTTITLDATESLLAVGPGGLLSQYGVSVPRKPEVASLASIILDVFPGKFEIANVYWAGEDLGATPLGFVNNLELLGILFEADDYAMIRFSGPDEQNAIYAQFLEFPTSIIPLRESGPDFSRLAEYFSIPDNFTIYYYEAGVEGEDISLLLDGQLNGRFRRIEEPTQSVGGASQIVQTGPNSAVRVNRALLYSARIDSDGDGIPNLFDSNPFEGVVLSTQPMKFGGETLVELSWNAAANTTYELQGSDDGGLNWKTLTTLDHKDARPGRLLTHDKVRGPDSTRMYRVLYRP